MKNTFDPIRELHHDEARLLASGRSTSEVAHLLGTSESQLIRQSQDPTFRELIARYRSVIAASNAASGTKQS